MTVFTVEEVFQGEEGECRTGIAGVEGRRVIIVGGGVKVGIIALGGFFEVSPDSSAGGGAGEGGLVAAGARNVDAGVDGGHDGDLCKEDVPDGWGHKLIYFDF